MCGRFPEISYICYIVAQYYNTESKKRPFRRQRPERAQDARGSEAHLGQGGVAVDGTVLLYAQAAEPVGKVQVLLQLFAGQLFQLVHRHAVPAQLPQEGADEACCFQRVFTTFRCS